jgi:hypothetical protein
VDPGWSLVEQLLLQIAAVVNFHGAASVLKRRASLQPLIAFCPTQLFILWLAEAATGTVAASASSQAF